MPNLLRHAAVFLWIRDGLGNALETSYANDTSISSRAAYTTAPVTSLSTAGLSSSSLWNATCPSRTVNYITHTLPRQCLRTDRVPHNSTRNATSADSDTAVTTTSVSALPATTVASEEHHLHSGHSADSTAASPKSVSDESGQVEHKSTSSARSESTDHIAGDAIETSGSDDSESPLDNANFLSFEDWKRQNLAKTGQSPDDVGRSQPINPNRPRPGINNALETLGEESEIDLDFTGFGGSAQVPVADALADRSASLVETHTGRQPAGSLLRSKDAGKTCKERTNYASFDCSATVLKSNKECKSASSVLVENKDSYMLNTCSADNKFFIVELCNDIQIDTIVLANYEFFSSSFRQFRVSVSDRYPVKMEKWRDLGTFEARNTREIQAFLVENPLIWAKYLRIEFLTHYGTEYYCPVSVLRVHGTTMIEEFRHQEQEELQDAEDEDLVTLEADALATPAVAQEPIESTDESAKATIQSIPKVVEDPSTTITNTQETEPVTIPAPAAESTVPTSSDLATNVTAEVFDQSVSAQVGAYEPANVSMTCENSATDRDTQAATSTPPALEDSATPIASAATERAERTTSGSSSESVLASNMSEPAPQGSHVPSNDSVHVTELAANSTPSHGSESAKAPESDQAVRPSTTTEPEPKVTMANSTMPSNGNAQVPSSTNATRSGTVISSSPPAAQPSTQESFFKSFHKRLQQLESNSTLSLQYIEEQSRILRDAFSKVEKRQVGTTTKFLSQLNGTVMAELHSFRQAYDQLWQSTVIELDGQRETYQREMLALSARLTMVADELVWQKRMGIIQSTILLLCLALVLFGRSSNGYLEVPLMQSVMNKSTAALRAGWESPPNSPSPDSRSPVSLFRRKLWRSSTEPAGETANITDSDISRPQTRDGPADLEVVVDPPSPGSPGLRSDTTRESNSLELDRKDESHHSTPATSPRKKKRQRKPPHSPSGSESRVKSPLAM